MSARLILARLRALRSRGDVGITLTELIVSMGLFSMIGAMTLGIFLSIDKATSSTTDRTISSASARNVIQSWASYVRVADGTTPGIKTNRIEWLTADDMLFYADLYNRSIDTVGTTSAPTMMWLRRDTSGTLVEEQFAGNAAKGAAPKVCRVLVGNVSTPIHPLFSGVDSSSNPLTNLGTAPTPTKGCQPLPVTVPSQTKSPDLVVQANLQKVSNVIIDFVVRDTKNAHPLEFYSGAVLPPLGGA